MSAKKKLLIFIPDGTGIKNYLLSSFISKASKEFEIILAHNFDPSIAKEIAIATDNYVHVNIPNYNETITDKFTREALCFARLNYNARIKSNSTILINWRRKKNHLIKKLFYKIIEAYGKFLSKKYKRIANQTKKSQQNLTKAKSIDQFKLFLKKIKPDLILTTHQRPVINAPLFAAAKSLNINSISVIYSWDNMPKARIPYYSDYFFVWSKYMKTEFEDYYPDINIEKVKITGTPQFEFYKDKSLLQSKEIFCKEHKINPNRPIVCYSGDDTLTSPFDPEYLDEMAEIFNTVEEKNRPQIILRPCPADDGRRFVHVLQKYSNIFLALPDWFEGKDEKSWYVKFAKKNDIKQLVNLAYHADAVVNVGSTMAHDFAMFNKPAFYLNYQPTTKNYTTLTPHKKNWSINTIYKYEHFKSMVNLNPVYWINSKDDFYQILKIINMRDSVVLNDQNIWKNRVLGSYSTNNSALAIVKELKEILN